MKHIAYALLLGLSMAGCSSSRHTAVNVAGDSIASVAVEQRSSLLSFDSLRCDISLALDSPRIALRSADGSILLINARRANASTAHTQTSSVARVDTLSRRDTIATSRSEASTTTSLRSTASPLPLFLSLLAVAISIFALRKK